ncbi:MAG: 50S ribosomal protein L6 [Candidatus Omnitrophica bacterium]|nr:50S ribosomal protein L6 [Candidatus Omnitrophota bacterium]
MSRIGKKPVSFGSGVKVKTENGAVYVEGSKGKLNFVLPEGIKVDCADKSIVVTRDSEDKKFRALHGLTRAIINNMVIGVSRGFEKELEIVGVGYKAQVQGKKLSLQIGRSHPVEYPIPQGITIETPKPTSLVIKGCDKQFVGEVAAEIRAYYPPEPYKGKGIRYKGEYVRKKAGKTGAK